MATRRQGGRQPGAWRAEAARLRRLGGDLYGPRRIAQMLGVSPAAVSRYLKSLGVEPKSTPEPVGWENDHKIALQQRIGWHQDEDHALNELPEHELTPGCYRTRPAPSSDDA